jgi:tRNA 5-methylaminomethyl-2-thiouridine biosynthesis bifunctional protein
MFLQGCGLPAAWAGRDQWRILAAGFGAGLDFLAAWHAWRSDPRRPRLLHYACIEAAPASVDALERAAQADPALGELCEQLRAQWRGLLPGFHRLAFEQGRVLLTLCVGERAPMLRELAFQADSVFLPAPGPGIDAETCSLPTLKAVTRLSRRGALLTAGNTSPGLQRDLQTCGWQVQPRPAEAVEREGLCARYAPAWEVKGAQLPEPMAPGDCIVVGAGLAGAAVAASLARRGWAVRVVDAAAQPAAGASSLPAGLLAPHQSPDDNLLSRLSRAGVRMTLREARQRLASGLEWEATGALEWRGEDRRPLPALGDALTPWSREASDAQKAAAGLATGQPAWWHENAAWIQPAALVRSWLREPGVRFSGGLRVAGIARGDGTWRLQDAAGATLVEAPLVVVASALGTLALLEGRVALHPVRGQVTWAPHGEDAAALPPFPVNGHGHFLPRVPLVERNAWVTGSTYGRGDADVSIRSEDVAANLQRVRETLPRTAEVMQGAAGRGELRSWSGVRCASSDRRPLLGPVEPGLWVSTAMGSRGLTFAALCGELLAARLHGEPLPIEARLAQALDAARPLRGG